MRHLCTLIAAVFVAPLFWLLLAFGQDGSARAFATAQHTGTFDARDFVRPVICLAGAGLMLGLLTTVRFSPLGVLLIGGGYAASYLGLLFDADGMLGLFPQRLSTAGRSIEPTTPIRTGTALLLGTFMVVTALSLGRWRRRSPDAEPAQQAPAERTRTRSPDAQRTGTSRPDPKAEPEPMTRYASKLPSGNGGPRHYAFLDCSTDRWALNSKAPWPYAQRP